MAASTAGESVIETRALTKRYGGDQLAVDGLDLTVPMRQRLRLPRAERLGQDHHHPHADGSDRADVRRGQCPRPPHAPRHAHGPPARRRAHRGPRPVRVPVRPGQPHPVRLRGPGRRPPHPPRPRRHRARPGGPDGRRGQEGEGVLARHEAAPRARGRAAPAPQTPRARRADERPGPAGHARNPFPGAGAGVGRHDGLPLLAPPRRDRAGLHARGRDGAGPASSRRVRSPSWRRAPEAVSWSRPPTRGTRRVS